MAAPTPARLALVVALALLLLATAPVQAQPTPIPVANPETQRNGQYSRAFQYTPAVGRFAHVAVATGGPGAAFPAATLILAGGVGAGHAPNTALPTTYMDTNAVSISRQPEPPSASGLDQLQMPLSNTAYDVVSDDWSTRATTGYALSYGGPDWTGNSATQWVAQLQFCANFPTCTATPQWSWLQFASEYQSTPRGSAAAAYLRNCFLSSTVPSGKCFIVFGGTTSDGTVLNTADVLRLENPAAPYWTEPSAINVGAPLPRFDHSLTAHYDGSTAFMFGGTINGGSVGSVCASYVTNELWQLAPAGFPDALPSEMINVINLATFGGAAGGAAAGGDPPVPANASISTGVDPLISGPASYLIDGIAMDGVANTASTLAQATVPGYNRCVFSPTAGAIQPYVTIDLGTATNFSAVALFGQTDCNVYSTLAAQQQCLTRMQDFKVFTGNSLSGIPKQPWDEVDPTNQCSPPATPQLVGGRSVVNCPNIYKKGGARYIWIVLPSQPGVLRTIGLCEVQVLRPQRWAWRQLSGLTVNAALSAPTGQTSQASTTSGPFAQLAGNGQGLLAFAASARAVDGVTTNDARSQSCAVTDCQGRPDCAVVVPGAFQEWHVNLGQPKQVRYIQVWPAVFDGQIGVGHGGPLVLPNRTLNWYVYAGNSQNAVFNTLCGGAPQDVSPYNQAADGSVTIPCVTQATFVQIRRYSGGSDGTDPDDAVAVCEVLVWVDQKINTPPARGGHAATGFKGQLFVFGGYDAGGYLLNDMYMYGMGGGPGGRWQSVNPLGTAPAGRSYAQLTVLDAQRLALSGGVAGTTPFKSVWSNLYAACSPIKPGGSFTGPFCVQGGSACQYKCSVGMVDNNAAANGWLICMPNGAWSGVNPPCGFAPPGPVNAAATTPASSTSAVVSWSAPTTNGANVKFYSVYTHDGADGSEWYDIFEDGFDTANSNYWWFDPTANATTGALGASSWQVSGADLQITAASGSSCFTVVAGQSGCPFLALNNVPASLVSLSNVAIETSLKIDNSSLFQPSVTAGISLVDYTTGLVQFILGVEYVPPYYYVVWQSFKGASPGKWRNLVQLYLPTSSGISVYLRIESSPATGGAFEAFYKVNAPDTYLPLQRPASFPTDFYGNTYYYSPFVPLLTNMLPAMVINNYQSTSLTAAGAGALVTAGFDFFRVAPPTCAQASQVAIVPGTTLSTTMTGLSPGASYVFDIVASNDPDAQGSGWSWGPEQLTNVVTMPSVAPPTFNPTSLKLVSLNRPSFMTPSYAAGGRPGLANDGATGTNMFGSNGRQACVTTPALTPAAVAASPFLLQIPLTWTVDLGRITDVEFIQISIASGMPPIDGFRIYLTPDAAPANALSFPWNEAATCIALNQPYSINAASGYITTFNCDASGRFVTVYLAPAVGVQLTLCEVSVWADNSCPTRNSSYATQSAGCFGATWGSVCSQTCMPGYTMTHGAANATCAGENWSGAPVVCEPLCPAVAMPVGVTTCLQSTFYDDFNDSPALVMSRWTPADPREAFGSFWFFDPVNFIMEANARKGCLGDMLLLSTRLASSKLSHAFTFEAVVKGRDAAGIAFRVMDTRNYYRLVVDSRGTAFELHAIKAGVKIVLASWPASGLRADVYYTVRAYVNGPSIVGTLNRWDDTTSPLGNVLVNVTDATFTGGGAGLYAETWAAWQLAHIYAPCAADANGCVPGMNEDQCLLFCRQGMNAIAGSQTMTCRSTTNATTGIVTAAWSSAPPQCAVAPVTFRVFTAQCTELLPVDSPCGDPLAAESFSVADTINYAINNNSNPFNAFYIDSCSGQLKVANQSAVDLALFPAGIQLQVTAFVVSAPLTSAVTATINIAFIRNMDAPVLPDFATYYLNENSPLGTVIATLSASNVEPGVSYDNITWTLDSVNDGAASDFVLAASTGVLSVTTRARNLVVPLDFESPPGVFTLFVHAARVSNAAMQDETQVSVVLVDMNDAPTIDPTLVLSAPRRTVAQFSSFSPGLLSSALDQDQNPAWNSQFGTAAPTFTLISPSAWGANSPCNWSLVVAAGAQLATIDGTMGGADLFSVGKSTGLVSLTVNPAMIVPPLSTDTPIVAFGNLSVASYMICVETSDTTTLVATPVRQLVPVIIVADLSSLTYLSGCTGPPVVNTTGGDIITCTRDPSSQPLPPTFTATYKTTVAPLLLFTTTCSAPDATTATCPIVPGVGANMIWSFSTASGGIAIEVPFFTSYKAPFVSAVKNYTTLMYDVHTNPYTEGGDNLTLSGANFGVGTGLVGAPPGVYSISVTFASAPIFGVYQPTQNPYTCAYTPPGPGSYSSDTRIQCIMPPGAGAGLVLTVTVGGQAFVPAVPGSGPTLQYQVPVIKSVYYNAAGFGPLPGNPGVDQLSANGGDPIVLVGEAFGPGAQPSEFVVASFGGSDGKLFTLQGCVHDAITPSTKLYCTTPPSQGTNLPLAINVATIASAVTTGNSAAGLGLSFIGPVIKTVSGPGTFFASTQGGEQIIITGTNFPPLSAGTSPLQTILLTYGPGATLRFTASQCVVTQALPSTPTIQCLSSPGTGTMDSWVLAVGGAASPVYTATAGQSYQTPQINSIAGTATLGSITAGTATLIINGQGFGPKDAYTNGVTKVFYGLPTNVVGAPPLNFQASGCTISIAFVQITCSTVAGVGAGLVINVVEDGLQSTTSSISYAAPMILGIYITQPTDTAATLPANLKSAAGVPLGDPNYLYNLTIRGSGFGPGNYLPFPSTASNPACVACTPGLVPGPGLLPGAQCCTSSYAFGSNTTVVHYDSICLGCITFGPTGSEDAIVPPNLQVHYSDTEIRVQVGQGAGGSAPMFMRIKAGNQLSAAPIPVLSPSFMFSPPACTYFSPTSADIISPDFTPTLVNMWVTNVPFLDPSASLVVCFGSCTGVAAQVISPADLPESYLGLYDLQNADGSYNITFQLPLYFSGAAIPVSLAQQRSGGYTTIMPATPLTTFTYNPPQISSLVVTPVMWQNTNPNCSQCGITGYSNSSGIFGWGPNPNPSCANAALQQYCAAQPNVYCPLPQGGIPGLPAWNCSNQRLFKIVILGKNFRTSPREQIVAPTSFMQDNVMNFAEILTPEANVTANLTTFVAQWEPNMMPGATAAKFGGLVTGFNPKQGCPYFPFYNCSFRASNNTFQYTDAWGNYRIEMYTTSPQGTVRVRLVSYNTTYCAAKSLTATQCLQSCNQNTGIGPGCITQFDTRAYSTLSSSAFLVGSPTGFNTTGGDKTRLLTMAVDQLATATSLQVLVGDGTSMAATPCPLAITNPPTSPTYVSDSVNNGLDIIKSQSCSGACPPPFWYISCVVPAGQGANQPVQVVRALADGTTETTTTSFTVSYAPPIIVSVNGSTSAVVALTIGGLLQVVGTNLGPNPKAISGGIPISNLAPCPGSGTSQTCYQFSVPPGEGLNSTFTFFAGNQFQTWPFSYAPPSVTSVVASKALLPTRGDPNMTVTITGTNFGQPNSGVPGPSAITVAFGYQSDGPASFIPCATANRTVIQTTIVCFGLPAGGGLNLDVLVTIAGISAYSHTNLSYAPPIITEAYALVFAPAAVDVADNFIEVLVTETLPVAGTNASNYNVVNPGNLTLYPCNNASNFRTRSCNGTVAQQSVCSGYGYDVASGLILNSTVICPPNLVSNQTSILASDPRLVSFSSTLANVVGGVVGNSSNSSNKYHAAYLKALPPGPAGSRILSMTGGKANSFSSLGVPTSWSLVPATAGGASLTTTSSLQLTGPSRSVATGTPGVGTTLIVLVGSNFGPGNDPSGLSLFPDKFSCPMLSWSYRTKTDGPYGGTLVCNGKEDYLGEGELDQALSVVTWDDAGGVVVFLVGQGIGLKDVEIVARRNSQASLAPGAPSRINFLFQAPQFYYMTPSNQAGGGFDPNGGSTVKATLEVLGLPHITAPTMYTSLSTCLTAGASSCPGNGAIDIGTFVVPLPLASAPQLPTAILIVAFFNANNIFAMVSDAYTIAGGKHPTLTQACLSKKINNIFCITEPFDRTRPGSLILAPPPGVGRVVNVQLQVWDLKQPGGTAIMLTSSATIAASYLAPALSYIQPQIVLLDDGNQGVAEPVVNFYGRFFSTDAVATAIYADTGNGNFHPTSLVGYTGSSSGSNNAGGEVVNGTFGGGYTCASTVRVENPGQAPYVACTISVGHAKCGQQQAFLEVAGQTSPIMNAIIDPSTQLPRLMPYDFIFGCQPGYFTTPGGSCRACPILGATCPGYDVSAPATTPVALRLRMPLAQEGYFDYNSSYGGGGYTNRPAPSDPTQPLCPYSVEIWPLGTSPSPDSGTPNSNYKPIDACIFPCHNAAACLGSNVCAQGYQSVAPYFRCATCATGYYMRAGSCVTCPSAALAVLIGYGLAIIATVALAWLFSKYEVHVALLSLGIDFMQTVSMLSFSKVQWAPSVKNLFWVLSASYLDVEIVAPECYDGYESTSFRDKFFAVMWLPVGIALGIALVHACMVLYAAFVKGTTSTQQRTKHLPAMISCGVLIASLLYMYETENLLQVFNCAALAMPTYDALYPGMYSTNSVTVAQAQAALAADWTWQSKHVIKYMQLAPEECYGTLAGTQAALLPYAAAFLVLGVAGWPLAVAWWLHRNRLIIMEDQLLRAKGQGADRLSGPNTYVFRKTWGRLYYQFKPELWFWQVVIYLRKFIFLVVMLVAWNRNGAYQMVGCAIALLCFYVLHVRMSPFMGPDTYEEVLRDHNNKSVTSALHARLRAAIQDVEAKGKRGTRKAVVDYNGKLNRGALLGAVLSALFDYNTVEAVLLFVAIMVCLLGVVNEVHVSYYSGTADSASYSIIMLVSFALIYFFLVSIWDTLLAAAAKATADSETRRRRTSKSSHNMASMRSRKSALRSSSSGEAEGADAGDEFQGGTAFHRRARGLVDAMMSDDARAVANAQRRAAMEADSMSSPIEVSINPLMNAGAGGLPPPPPGPPPDSYKGASIAPGDLEALRDAVARFPGVPPPELWNSFRSAFGDAVRSASDKDTEVASLKQQLADADTQTRELRALLDTVTPPPPPPPSAFGASMQALGLQQQSPPQAPQYASTNALQRVDSLRHFSGSSDRLKALKPSPRPGSTPRAERQDFGPVSAVSAGTGASWRGAMAPPPPPPPPYPYDDE